jgi:hypothetical protein
MEQDEPTDVMISHVVSVALRTVKLLMQVKYANEVMHACRNRSVAQRK